MRSQKLLGGEPGRGFWDCRYKLYLCRTWYEDWRRDVREQVVIHVSGQLRHCGVVGRVYKPSRKARRTDASRLTSYRYNLGRFRIAIYVVDAHCLDAKLRRGMSGSIYPINSTIVISPRPFSVPMILYSAQATLLGLLHAAMWLYRSFSAVL